MKHTIGENGIVGIRVTRGTHYVYHKCCDCGCMHRVDFEWPRGGVIMKWRRVEMEERRDSPVEKGTRKALTWLQDWISDFFGLFDTVVGILTLTLYYPRTQAWFFRECGR